MRKKDETQVNGWIHIMGIIIAGSFLALSICLVILFICSILISNGMIHERVMLQCTAIACLIGSFCGALYSVLRIHVKTLIVGVFSAAILILMILLAGSLLFRDISLSGTGSVVGACCLAGGTLAGFLGANKKKKRRK